MKLPRTCLLALVIVAITVFLSGCLKMRSKRADPAKSSLSSQPLTKGKPKIVALEKEHDFGKVKEGTTLEYVFRVSNQGDRELVIEKASGS
jgi:hypothetical protein